MSDLGNSVFVRTNLELKCKVEEKKNMKIGKFKKSYSKLNINKKKYIQVVNQNNR